MTKKTLKEKIEIVSWWTLGLSILYFSIGAWLKSDGSHFDPAKTYELIKDTLTLTAAFLAPVAAFILFNDWREEHIKKENEGLAIDIYDAVERGLLNLKMLHIAINIEDNYNTTGENSIQQKLSDSEQHLLELKLLLNRSNKKRNELKKILIFTEAVFVEMRQLHTDFQTLHNCFMQIHFPEREEYKIFYFDNESRADFLARRDRDIDEIFESIDEESIHNLQKSLKEIKKMSDELRI